MKTHELTQRTARRPAVRAVLLMLAIAWPAAASADAASPSPEAAAGLAQLRQVQAAFAYVAEKVSPTVVAIQARRKLSSLEGFGEEDESFLRRFGDRLVPSVGSGVIISSDGFILTNDHVAALSEDLVVVLANRRRFHAKLVGSDPRSDLAVIKVDAKDLPAADLGDLATVRQGHWAIAMGNAFGLASEGRPGMTVGIVSAIGRGLPNLGDGADRHYGNLIQTSADINPGNSGGPLLDLEGRVIGINTAISSRSGVSEGVGFAVPMTARTRTIIQALREGRKIEYGFLGVVVRSPLPDESTRAGAPEYAGAIVDMVEAGTPAARADIKVGDVIVQVDEDVVEDSDHLVRAIGGSPIGSPVTILLWRDKKELTVKAVLAKRDEAMARRRPELETVVWRGLTVVPLSDAKRKALKLADDAGGVEVAKVADGSPAQTAGIKSGDVIDGLGGKPVKTVTEFARLTAAVEAKEDVAVHLLKGGDKTIKPK